MSDRLRQLRVVDPVLTHLARGYRNIAYMADPPIYGPGRDRLRGFRDACKEFGVTVPQENIFLRPFYIQTNTIL